MKKSKNWGQPCPNKNCEYYGKLNKGNIISRDVACNVSTLFGIPCLHWSARLLGLVKKERISENKRLFIIKVLVEEHHKS